MNYVAILASFVIGFLSGIFANFVYEMYVRRGPKSLIESALDDSENWICNDGCFYKNDPDIKILFTEKYDSVQERFNKFPDKTNNFIQTHVVKYKDAVYYQWNFLYLDGLRYVIPCPEVQYATENDDIKNLYDYYDIKEEYIKLYKITGRNVDDLKNDDKLGSLKKFASRLNIHIKN